MTLRELDYFAEGHNKAKREAFRQQIAVTHLSASLARVPRNKRLPTLDSLLPKEPRTPSEIRRQAALNTRARLALMAKPGELIYKKRKT